VAARLRREGLQVDMAHGRYGELTIAVDGTVVAATNALGWPPTVGRAMAAVHAALARG
jgi:hypothetical protein